MKKKILIIFFFSLLIITYVLLKGDKSKDINQTSKNEEIQETYNSNIIKNVSYRSKDLKGNEYIVKAKEGEIDLSDSNIIFLKQVNSIINLVNKNTVLIVSDYGKYNIGNQDTIFNKNVKVTYLDNLITAEYLDFSINRNSLIISKNVVYSNTENILKANVIEMDIETKDTKIYMYDNKEQVKIRSK